MCCLRSSGSVWLATLVCENNHPIKSTLTCQTMPGTESVAKSLKETWQRARGGEGALAPSCRVPHGHDQIPGELFFPFFPRFAAAATRPKHALATLLPKHLCSVLFLVCLFICKCDCLLQNNIHVSEVYCGSTVRISLALLGFRITAHHLYASLL